MNSPYVFNVRQERDTSHEEKIPKRDSTELPNEVEEWKKRAIEAENKNRLMDQKAKKLVAALKGILLHFHFPSPVSSNNVSFVY